MTPPVLVLGMDPGFASFGQCLVKLLPEGEKIITVRVFTTKKDDKKRKTLASDDNYHRTVEIFSDLDKFVRKYRRVMAATAEAASSPRNASAAAKVALAWGAVAGVLTPDSIPLAQASPQKIKKTLCGRNNASKKEVQEALLEMYPGQFDVFMKEYPKTLWEHGFDAVGSVVACLQSDVVCMARRMLK